MAISVKSFSSIWYWIFTGIAWSMTCHYTLGVPHDMLVRAHSKGGTHADDAEALAAMQVRRLTNLFSKGGTFVVAVVAFLLAMVATFGFYYGYELAQASFMLLAPLVLVQIYMVRLAFRVKERGLVGAQLRKALRPIVLLPRIQRWMGSTARMGTTLRCSWPTLFASFLVSATM